MKQKKFPELNALRGLLAQFKISNEQLSKLIGRCRMHVNNAINGYTAFALDDCKEIQKIINEKSKLILDDKGNFKSYTLDDIFFTQSASKTKRTA